MRSLTTILACVLVVFSLVLVSSACAGDVIERITTEVDGLDVSPQMKTFIKEKLIPQCTNDIFVAAVQSQNDKGMTLDEIKSIDTTWTEAEDELPIHAEMMSNDCAKEIENLATAITGIGETFVMDNQGANVGQNELTSDYWQGDEAKWQDAYRDGQGGVTVSEPKLDKSTGQVDQKVSLPIVDGDGNVIGAVCFGVNPNSL